MSALQRWVFVLTALVAGTLLLFSAVAASVSASSQQLPRGEPAFPEDQLKRLPPGVTVKSDGTVLKDGQPTGATLLPDTAQRRKDRQMARYATTWKPFFLYLNDSSLFSPLGLDEIIAVEAPRQRITALASAPGSQTLIYAVTESADSVIFLQDLDRGPRQEVARASQLSPGLWFHAPASLSPDKRWLLIAASTGLGQELFAREGAMSRAEALPGDVWLLDCTAQAPPRRVLQEVVIRSFSWSPNGQRVICQVQRNSEDQTSSDLLLLEVERGETRALPVAEVDPRARIFWTVDGAELIVLPEPGKGGEGISYRFDSEKLGHFIVGISQAAQAEGVWSLDGTRAALVLQEQERRTLRVLRQNGLGRTCATPLGVKHLLGWSEAAQLLAYIAADGTLAVCSGAIGEGDYERLMSAHSAESLARDESRPGPHKSAREHTSLDTISSPVRLNLSGHLRFAWLSAEDGPCLVYAEATEMGEALRALRFRRMSLADLGLDPHGDLRAQLARQEFGERMVALTNALTSYVRAHDGNLPPHAEGKDLQEALKPYLCDPGALFGGPGQSQAYLLLLLPGANVKGFLAPLKEGRKIKVAELQYDGLRCSVYAVESGGMSLEEELGITPPLPVNFWGMVDSDAPPAGSGG